MKEYTIEYETASIPPIQEIKALNKISSEYIAFTLPRRHKCFFRYLLNKGVGTTFYVMLVYENLTSF